MDLLWVFVLACYGICVAQSLYSLTTTRPPLQKVGFVVLLAGLGAHTAWLLLQGIRTGRCPIAGTQEMCAFLSWGLVIAFLAVSRWYQANALRAFIFPIVFVLVTVAAITPGATGQPEGLTSPIQRLLFPVHAGLILLAYAAFFIAFGAGLMYIIQERELKLKRFGTIFYRLPPLETCDSISFKSLVSGFVLLTLGIAAGIAWSRARDGVFFHGEPIEVFAGFTWLVYLLIIQSRMHSSWGGRTAALASIVSFMIVVFSLVGVRYLGTLHMFG